MDYTYDSLDRLITAATTGPQWGLSFTYDGFGNRTAQSVTKGSGPTSCLGISASTNRIISTGYGYDSNGNLTTMPYGAGSMILSYNIENRLIQATNTNGTEKYSYDPDSSRVYRKKPDGTEWVFFYGAGGERLKTYTLTGGSYTAIDRNLYFAGRLVWSQSSGSMCVDRLGSVRNETRYYPYGEEQAATANDKDKFANYFRDSTTGLDYTINRYYSSQQGRFTTPDPFMGSADPEMPLSWNRYAYVEDDPVNENDPSGLFLPGNLGWKWPSRDTGGKDWWHWCQFTGMCGNSQGQGGPSGQRQGGAGSRGGSTGGKAGSSTATTPANNGSDSGKISVGYTVNVVGSIYYFLGPAFTYTKIPALNLTCFGGGLGASAGHNYSFGPTVVSTQDSKNILSGWSFSAGYNSTPQVGVGGPGNLSGAAGGNTFGVPGVGASPTWSKCWGGK